MNSIERRVERRALYHLLYMNWLDNPSLPVEAWQAEDYRSFDSPRLFGKLADFAVHLDRMHFIAYADESDSPEDLTDRLIGDRALKPSEEDQIYLVVFELWRRLIPDKPSLSIVCNELDYQIYLYDHQRLDNPLALQDALLHFSQVLDENVDGGILPVEAIKRVSSYCANDVETFLYDFISEQIEEGNEIYAQELLDGFDIYLNENKWFKLLRLRLFGYSGGKISQKLTEQILEDHLDDGDLEFNLEFLFVLAEIADERDFRSAAHRTFLLLENQEHLHDFLEITSRYFHRSNQKKEAETIDLLLHARSNRSPSEKINGQEPGLKPLLDLLILK